MGVPGLPTPAGGANNHLCYTERISIISTATLSYTTATWYTISTHSLGASLAAQWWRICLPMQETQVQSLRQEDPPEKEMAITPIFLPRKSVDRGARRATDHRVTRVGHDLATKPPSPPTLLASNNMGICWVSHNDKRPHRHSKCKVHTMIPTLAVATLVGL